MKSFENRTSSDLLILILALISVSIHLLVIGKYVTDSFKNPLRGKKRYDLIV